MTNKKIKRMLDACYQAKRIREMLPPLPEGIVSSHIRYMDIIQELQKQKVHVRVSDLSDVLNIPRPGVTRTIKEMEKKDADCMVQTIQKFYDIMCERSIQNDR